VAAIIQQKTLLLKSQADGAQALGLRLEVANSSSATEGLVNPTKHQIQIEESATPSAGTLAIAGRNPGATDHALIGTVNLTDVAELLQIIEGVYDSLQFTPTGFDADKTYSIHVVSYQ
jgi:hypothetical protein